MKLSNVKKKVSTIIAGLVILGQIIISSVMPVVANANIVFPQQVTIEYDANNLYVLYGTLTNGSSFAYKNAPLFAVYQGNRQPVFCYEPTVSIVNSVTPGYTSNPLPDLIANNQRVKYISVLWKYVGTDADTQMVAQAMFWSEVNGLTTTRITRSDGSLLSNQQEIENKINQVVDDYLKMPSFNGQTVKVNLGDSVTLTDVANSNLSNFDKEQLNSANINYAINGSNLVITPKKDSNVNGTLSLMKSSDVGTPVAYQLAGQQSVVAGAIDDPSSYQINIEVVKTGEVKISKLDKETGKVVPNTEFKVEYDGKSQTVKTNDKGEAIVKDILHDTTVKVTETFVPAPYILDTNNTKEVVIQAGKTASVEFKNEVATGKTTLVKQDATTNSNASLHPNYPMVGAKYGLFKQDGTLLKEFTLDENLTATMDKLELGSYYWSETLAPTGYTLDQTKHIVELTYKDQYTPIVVQDAKSNDDVIRMNLDGQKLIQNETNEIFKNDVEFTLTNKRTGETHVVKTATLNGKKGYFQFADIALDDYVLTETKGVEGYKNVDPIEITHSYDKDTETFTFVVKDQKSGNMLNEEKITQLELSKGVNVDLGTYTLKDKAKVNEIPSVGISTQAHTGDGETQTFIWGEDVQFYDDVNISHQNIEVGTERAYETILVAVYKNGEKDVWTSGKIDYSVTDKDMTEKVIAEYNYKKDPQGTRYYFKEVGYNKPSSKEYKKDVEHNADGKEKTQTITPIIKEMPKEETPKAETPKAETPKAETPKAETPKAETLKEKVPQAENKQGTSKPIETGLFPKTGEEVKRILPIAGLFLILAIAMYLGRKVLKETPENK